MTNFVNPGKSNYSLYVSDGSDKIQIVDGDTFNTIGSIAVRDESNSPVKNINELEYASGLIWANIWFSNDIIAINPADGKVVKRFNMSSLKKAEAAYQRSISKYGMDVLNGIAYDPSDDTYLLTGKKWHLVFKVKFY